MRPDHQDSAGVDTSTVDRLLLHHNAGERSNPISTRSDPLSSRRDDPKVQEMFAPILGDRRGRPRRSRRARRADQLVQGQSTDAPNVVPKRSVAGTAGDSGGRRRTSSALLSPCLVGVAPACLRCRSIAASGGRADARASRRDLQRAIGGCGSVWCRRRAGRTPGERTAATGRVERGRAHRRGVGPAPPPTTRRSRPAVAATRPRSQRVRMCAVLSAATALISAQSAPRRRASPRRRGPPPVEVGAGRPSRPRRPAGRPPRPTARTRR